MGVVVAMVVAGFTVQMERLCSVWAWPISLKLFQVCVLVYFLFFEFGFLS